MKRAILVSAIAALSLFAVPAQTPFGINDLLSVKRVADPQLSPDGKTVAYTVGTVDKAANKVINQIFSRSVDGGNPKQLTSGSMSSSNPRWSPDGRRIAYTNGGQIWTMKSDGDDKQQITRISTGASGPIWSPDGRSIAFGSDVYPECTTDACNKAADDKAEESKVKAHVTDRLLFRHWVEWRDRKRSHVFIVSSSGGAARDMTPGDFDSPPYAAASGVDYAFSPDGSQLAYLRNPDKIEAASTNSDIYLVSVNGGEARDITASMKGYDVSPTFTPNGKYLLFRSEQTPAFEADRWRIMRYDLKTGEITELTKGFDLQVEEMTVSADSSTIYFAAGERGYAPVFSIPVEPDFRSKATYVKKVVQTMASSLNVSADGKTLVYAAGFADTPTEIWWSSTDGKSGNFITAVNAANTVKYHFNKAESIEWSGAGGTKVQGFVIKPPNFDPARKYPLIVLIHGGPQSAWNDSWGYRWNPQVFANQGYVVFMPNPRGSTGYGQKFVNDISGDWGGKAFIDIQNGVAEMARKPFVDKDRIGAAGASYGGYMVDWLLGHNNDPRFKIKAFVSHAGVYNLESMAAATEELWFVNWEFKGMPWENAVNYNRWSPNKFAKAFATPTLVTCGEVDFRVPYDQSLQLYTTLQLKGVPSKLIVFPDEGHWILKPQNSEFWYNNVLDWFQKYLKQ
ncbi:MAG: S9 family peptidase [Acidobacteria bacterium]|nr:S9 family peptidase [Acidobacteriota bacterium]